MWRVWQKWMRGKNHKKNKNFIFAWKSRTLIYLRWRSKNSRGGSAVAFWHKIYHFHEITLLLSPLCLILIPSSPCDSFKNDIKYSKRWDADERAMGEAGRDWWLVCEKKTGIFTRGTASSLCFHFHARKTTQKHYFSSSAYEICLFLIEGQITTN